MISTSWKRVRDFNYGDLRVLYIACLVTIAFVYTVFRSAQFYLNHVEVKMSDVIQTVDNQRELLARLEQHARPMSDEILALNSQLRQNHEKLFRAPGRLAKKCHARPCHFLFSTSALPTSLIDDQGLTEFATQYRNALNDALKAAHLVIENKDRQDLIFDIMGFVTLMTLLAIQAIFIFRPAIRRLSDSLATRSEFLSRISHEIRNPMNSILGMADILKGTRLNSEQQQYVDNLIRSGSALLDMLDNLIDFSVIEAGRLTLKPGPMDLFGTIDRCLNLIAVQAHHKNLNVYLYIDPRVPNRLIGDAIRVQQVLLNLLNNAVKFTEQGYISLSVALEHEDEGEVQLIFSVADSGIGIETKQRNEIFESFVQGDSSIQRKYGGSGLGLSIVREIIRLMGGAVDVESTPGQGSRFFFDISLIKQSPYTDTPEAPLLKLKARRFIFIVAQGEAEHYRGVFAKMSCQATVLQSTKELREKLQTSETEPMDAVIIDDSVGIISMINCRNLADEFGLGDQSMALIRSNSTKENMDLLKRNGFTRFLIKPLKPWELLSLPTQVTVDDPQKNPLSPSAHGLVDKLKEKNLKILLVDDSNDNLFLLKEVIHPLASVIHFASNGLEAIEKFRDNPYDVVFMDIQMPVMDGYTAIRKMRDAETRTGQTIPIYAVTAHAGLVDAQKCREAGFTDRIVKPVVRGDIYRSLSQAFALEVNDFDGEQENVLPAKYLAKLMPTYFKTRFEDLGKLRLALEKSDFNVLKNLGHKIKGSAASYGFADAAELSLNLEQAALAKDLAVCTRIVDRLDNMFHEERERFRN